MTVTQVICGGIIIAGVFVFVYLLLGLSLIPYQKKLCDDRERGLRHLRQRIARAHHIFYMLSDGGCSLLFCDPPLLEILRKAVKRGVDVRFIFLRREIYQYSPFFGLVCDGAVGLAFAPESSIENFSNHFQISDISLYLEDPHLLVGEEEYNRARSGVWFRIHAGKSKKYTEKFLALWGESEQVKPGYRHILGTVSAPEK